MADDAPWPWAATPRVPVATTRTTAAWRTSWLTHAAEGKLRRNPPCASSTPLRSAPCPGRTAAARRPSRLLASWRRPRRLRRPDHLRGRHDERPVLHSEGVDRTSSPAAGAGMTFELADGASVDIDQTSRPFGFTADDPCHATLTDGPVTDLNVMTRRSAFRHRGNPHLTGSTGPDRSVYVARAGELTLLAVLTGRPRRRPTKAASCALFDTRRYSHALPPPRPASSSRVGLDSPTEVLLLVDFTRR